MDMSAFHLARMDLSEVREMAELFPIDQIFDNRAYPGLLANAFIDAGIPAFTPEIGAPRILDHRMIPLFVEGTMNVLKHHGIVTGPMGRTGRDTDIFVANSGHATHAGKSSRSRFAAPMQPPSLAPCCWLSFIIARRRKALLTQSEVLLRK
jgi:hypothetical protein